MPEPSVGDSRKKGIAITAITAIVALKPQTYMDLAVVAGVVIIALYGMRLFAQLEKKPKISIDKPPVPPIE